MSSGFWHPTHELRRLAGGWVMRRTRYGNTEGAIIPTERGLEVWVRNGGEATPVGIASSLSDAATALWWHGREARQASRRVRLRPF